jgi:hypothetical protein
MNWYTMRPPEQMGDVPFLHPQVVEFLSAVIHPSFEIMEHGSGASTLWFAKRCKSVLSVESNIGWFRHIAIKAPNNSVVVHGNDIQPGLFDLILIDGEPIENRAAWMREARQHLKPNGWIVLDNANRPEYTREREQARVECVKYFTFDGNEPNTRYLVTDFFLW